MSAVSHVMGLPLFEVAAAPSSPGNFVIDASGERLAFVFQSEEDATITNLGFRYGARTGTPPTYIISLQAIDASGLPDGTVLGGGTPASATFTPPASAAWDGTWQWVALSNSYAVTRGTFYAIVIEYSSGTIDGSNNSSFTQRIASLSPNRSAPYNLTHNAVSWTKQSDMPVYGYKSASVVYGFPVESIYSTAYGSSATPDEIGLKFTLTAGIGATYQVLGISGLWRVSAATHSWVMTLYDSGDTVLQTITLDGDALSTTGAALGRYLFDESTLSTLNFGDTYRVTLTPATTTTAYTVYGVEADTSAEAAAFPEGNMFQWTERTNAGAWTDRAERRPLFGIIVADITEPSAGGGLQRPVAMNGGMV